MSYEPAPGRLIEPGVGCSYESEATAFDAGTALRFSYFNLTSEVAVMAVIRFEPDESVLLDLLARPQSDTYGFALLSPGSYQVACAVDVSDESSRVSAAVLTAE